MHAAQDVVKGDIKLVVGDFVQFVTGCLDICGLGECSISFVSSSQMGWLIYELPVINRTPHLLIYVDTIFMRVNAMTWKNHIRLYFCDCSHVY